MNNYKIKVIEKLERVVDINDKTYEDSVIEAEDKYYNQEVILDTGDHVSTEFELDDSVYEVTKEQYLQLLKQKFSKVRDSFNELSNFLVSGYSDENGMCYDANVFFTDEVFDNIPFNESVEEFANDLSNWIEIILDLPLKNDNEVCK